MIAAMADREWIVGGGEAGERLDKFLAAPDRLGSRGRAAAAVDRGKVFVNGQDVDTHGASRRLAAGDRVRLWMDRPGSGQAVRARRRRDGDLVIVYEDASLLVVDKPPGILAVPLAGRDGESMAGLVAGHLRSQGKRQPQIVHRIDRDTSGLVVFAKDGPALGRLKAQFLRREPERVYLAVVHGQPRADAEIWRDRLRWDAADLIQRPAGAGDRRAAEAVSEVRVLERLRGAALLEVRLVTGKRNQIRAQAALRGHPLVGEQMYTAEGVVRPIAFGRQALHAWRLGFRHPQHGRPMRFEAPVPADLMALIEKLGGR
jgi:23S rRNA pseudouridine1911/1915/1917 synthase